MEDIEYEARSVRFQNMRDFRHLVTIAKDKSAQNKRRLLQNMQVKYFFPGFKFKARNGKGLTGENITGHEETDFRVE